MARKKAKSQPQPESLPPMLFATATERHAYWAHTNRQFRRPAKTVGDALAESYPEGFEQRFRIQGQIADLLSTVLPPDLAAQVSLGTFRGGTLTLCVPGGPWAFHLQRGMADHLANVFQTQAPDLGVRRVRFKVG